RYRCLSFVLTPTHTHTHTHTHTRTPGPCLLVFLSPAQSLFFQPPLYIFLNLNLANRHSISQPFLFTLSFPLSAPSLPPSLLPLFQSLSLHTCWGHSPHLAQPRQSIHSSSLSFLSIISFILLSLSLPSLSLSLPLSLSP